MRWSWGSVAGALLSVLFAAAPARAARTTPEGVTLGAKLFAVECAGCHGIAGDGKGVADAEMQPRPRDITSGKFKLRSTWSRTPTTSAELLATISNGIPGTAMPSFRFLSEEDRRHLVEYVASIAHLPDEEKVDAVPIPPEPPVTPQLLESGKQLYADLGCAACHGPEGRGDGAAAPHLKDEWGSKTPPRNFTADPFKGGESDRDLYLRFAIGMPGTPMPSYADTISPEKVWALVMYVQSLRPKKGGQTPPADAAARGEQIVAEKHCLACHSLPSGDPPARRGGNVGPPLDREARLLDLGWMEQFLQHPRDHGKIYPAFPYRMPDLQLSAPQAQAVVAYLASIVGREPPPAVVPTPKLDAADLLRGGALFTIACAPCHQLGDKAATAPLDEQGPNLSSAARRYDYDAMVRYITDPEEFDARSVMKATRLPPAEVRAIAEYVWSRTD